MDVKKLGNPGSMPIDETEQNSVNTPDSGQAASLPDVHTRSDAAPGFMAKVPTVATGDTNTSPPHWRGNDANAISQTDEHGTASSSGRPPAKQVDQTINGIAEAGCDALFDIAAAEMDLETGLRLMEEGAKPGPNCTQQFLDQLLAQAIKSKSESGMRNLLGHGADWNLFFYDQGKNELDFINSTEFLKPALAFHLRAKNTQATIDIVCLWAGSDAQNNEKFDEEIALYAADKTPFRIKNLLDLRHHVVGTEPSKPTAAMMRAIQIAASDGCAANLALLLDYQMSMLKGRSDTGRSSKAFASRIDNIPPPGQVFDMEDRMGQTLLHLAAKSGNEETVALLLDRGANLGKLDEKLYWPLTLAVKGGHTAVAVRILRAALAAPDTWPDRKAMIRTAFSHASPEMRTALGNANDEVQPGPPASVAARLPYEPYEDL